MIASKDDGEGAGGVSLSDLVVEALADARDFADVFLARVARHPGFGNGDQQVALFDDGATHGLQSLAKSSYPDGRWAHIHPTATAAKVQGHTQDVHDPGCQVWHARIMAFRTRKPTQGGRKSLGLMLG